MMDVTHVVLGEEDARLLTEIRDAIRDFAKTLRNLDPDGHLPEECQQHECTYYQHYLAFGPPDLTHDGYHAAEMKCAAVQMRASKWLEEHQHDSKPVPKELEKLCRNWEERIRA